MLVRDHIAAAAASAEYGDKRGAIVSLAIACELFLDSLLAAMLWEDGATPELAAESWQQPSIVRRVKNEYAPRLGGTWDPNRAGPLSDWLNHVVNVRNSVLHSGRSPSSSEVQLAGGAAGRLTNFLARRLVLSWAATRKPWLYSSVTSGLTSMRPRRSGRRSIKSSIGPARLRLTFTRGAIHGSATVQKLRNEVS
jgi:hypothetical protein